MKGESAISRVEVIFYSSVVLPAGALLGWGNGSAALFLRMGGGGVVTRERRTRAVLARFAFSSPCGRIREI